MHAEVLGIRFQLINFFCEIKLSPKWEEDLTAPVRVLWSGRSLLLSASPGGCRIDCCCLYLAWLLFTGSFLGSECLSYVLPLPCHIGVYTSVYREEGWAGLKVQQNHVLRCFKDRHDKITVVQD